MGDVVDLASRRQDPHTSGPCQCLVCGHRWVGIVPRGTFVLECPNCQAHTGVRASLVSPPPDVYNLSCDCGNDRFLYLETHVLFCDQCGQTYDPDYDHAAKE